MIQPIRFAMAALALALATPLAAEDVAGSADHPLIGRYDGSTITGYSFVDFDEYPLPQEAGQDGFRTIEGKVTRIAYVMPEEVSIPAAERNFAAALEAAGFETVFNCDTDACGGISYDLDQFPIPRMMVDRFNYRVQTGRLARAEGDVYAMVLTTVDTAGRTRVQLGVVETAPLEIRMIDAVQMQADVSETGRVALYGITFETDSAEIRPESAPTIAEIAAFLTASPDLSVVIVGHTDNQGSLEYNLGLSQRRALSVRDALVGEHGISGDRMQHAGAGFLAPVAPNTTEDGRALNRRVEIIAR